MNYSRNLVALGALWTILTSVASADPLPGETLKFQQQPMVTTTVGGIVYNGHDELSTLYGFPATGVPTDPVTDYQGTTMADDFADAFNTPVVHVRWWGSYEGNINPATNPIDSFLIAFESDLPAVPPNNFSRPDQVLNSQIVRRGPLAPGSGTFSEKLLFTAPPGGEDIYEYNAELHLGKEFFQDPNTVYWLKIAALTDIQDFDGDGDVDAADIVAGSTQGLIPQWGWHNRDYTIADPYALAVTPPVLPGERDEAAELGIPFPTEVWHFQDDAVVNSQTTMQIDPSMPTMPLSLQQDPGAYLPTNYVAGLDGPSPVDSFSKDLAFELYTIPEPATCLLLVMGLCGIAADRRRR